MAFTIPEDSGGEIGRRHTAGRSAGRLAALAGFAVFSAVGILTLAGVVILPEYAALADLQAGRDALAHQVRCEEKLVAYDDRMIRATQDDPVLIARLMIRHSNYRPAGCETVEVAPAQSDLSVPQQLLDEARTLPPRQDNRLLLVRAGFWLADPTTSRSMILLALAMLVIGAIVGRGGVTRSVLQ